jgi:hypothetical protein
MCSPEGTLWSSFKDASSSLLSSIRHESTSKNVVLLKHGRGMVVKEGMCAAERGTKCEALQSCGDDINANSSVAEKMDCKYVSLHLSNVLDETEAKKGSVFGNSVDRCLGGSSSELNFAISTRYTGIKAETT